MRIIGGRFRSRRLGTPPPPGVRPTSDRLRETLFDVIGHRVPGSVFLDGYAGVGAVGIEAISRGADSVFFVDRSARSVAAIRANLSLLGVDEGYRVLQMEFARSLRLCIREGVSFDVVFLDPPYDRTDLYQRDLEQLGGRDLLSAGALVVVEHRKTILVPSSAGRLRAARVLAQGDSVLTFYRLENG